MKKTGKNFSDESETSKGKIEWDVALSKFSSIKIKSSSVFFVRFLALCQSCTSFFRTKWRTMRIVNDSVVFLFVQHDASWNFMLRMEAFIRVDIMFFDNLHTFKRLAIVDELYILTKIYASSSVFHCISKRLKHQPFRLLFPFNCRPPNILTQTTHYILEWYEFKYIENCSIMNIFVE